MGFCTNCGSTIPERAQFCTNCGTKSGTVQTETESVSVPPPPPPPAPSLYYVAYATGQVGGPFEEEVLRDLIAQQRVKVTDSVRPASSTAWVPVVQSKFAPLAAQQANMDRLVASTCPSCGAGMAVVIKRSKAGLVLVIVGILLTPILVGIPIFIVGYIMRWGGKGQAGYRCPRCNYAS